MSNYTMHVLEDDGSFTLIKRGPKQYNRTWSHIEDGKAIFRKNSVKVLKGVKGYWMICVKGVERAKELGIPAKQFIPVTA